MKPGEDAGGFEPLLRGVPQQVERESIPWQIWFRVCHGGEKRVDVARSLGYKNGSAITHILKRLDKQCKDEPTVANHAVFLTKKLRDISSFKASTPPPDPASRLWWKEEFHRISNSLLQISIIGYDGTLSIYRLGTTITRTP